MGLAFQIVFAPFYWIVFSITIGILSAIYTCSNTFALTANSSAMVVNIGVLFQRMAFYTLFLSRVFGSGPFTQKNIGAARYSFKVFWINAAGVFTFMVNMKAFRYITYEDFIRNSMRQLRFTVTVDPNLAIAAGAHGGLPKPASPGFLNFFNESFFQSLSHGNVHTLQRFHCQGSF